MMPCLSMRLAGWSAAPTFVTAWVQGGSGEGLAVQASFRVRGRANREPYLPYLLQKHPGRRMFRVWGFSKPNEGFDKPCGFRVEGVRMLSSEKLKGLQGLS